MLGARRQTPSKGKRFIRKCWVYEFSGVGMSALRLRAGVAICALTALAVPQAAHAAFTSIRCDLTPTALGPAVAAANPGDTIQITGICQQDVTITTPGLTITNRSGPTGGLNASDGVQGQLEISGATGTIIDGVILGSFSAFSFGSSKDMASLFAHDGAAVTVNASDIENSPLLGVLAARSSKVEITSATSPAIISANGNGTADTLPRDNGGIQARDNGTIILGSSDGSQRVTVSNNPADAVAAYRNSSIVIYAAGFTSNTARQVVAESASSAHLTLASTTIDSSSSSSDAIAAVGTSTLQIDAGVSVTGGAGGHAISLQGGSALLLQGSNIGAFANGGPPVIEASSGSVVALAGGNTICSGRLSGSCLPDGGIALQIDHVGSLVQVSAADFGYTPATESVFGGGIAVLQSTIDLGLGVISSNPSLTWTTGGAGISVVQNSSVRMNGGVTVTGTLVIGQASNGFFNRTKGGSNAVTSITCPFTTVPASHIVAGTVGSPAVTPFPNPSTNFNTTSKASAQCLSF